MAQEISFPYTYEKESKVFIIDLDGQTIFAGPKEMVITHRWEVAYDHTLSIEENIQAMIDYIDANYE